MLYIIWYTSPYKRYIVYTTYYTPILPIILSYHTDIHIPPGIQLVYNMYTPGFIFKGCLYDHHSSTLSQAKYFPIVPVACGCLLVGSTPPWGPGPQYSFIVYNFKTDYLLRGCVVYTNLHLSKYGAYIL